MAPRKSTTATLENPTDAVTFEEALDELEKVIDALEADNLTLDIALDKFERGVRLMKVCDSHLKKAHGRLTQLLKGEDGQYVEKILGNSLDAFIGSEDIDG